ncbi:MAG: DM13 domain-containing protein [Pseudomonadota bacterium]
MIKARIISALAFALAACGQEAAESASEAPEVITGEVIARGVFEGASDHVTTGGVTIRKGADGYYVTLEEDFSLDGAPDPKLGFGNPDYAAETQFSALKSKTGYQSYKLPEGFDPTGYQTIYVWCEQFSVPLGVATLG